MIVCMKTVQMTLDEKLLRAVDAAARKLRKSRSGFTREALKLALRQLKERAMERQHRKGYERQPQQRDEFAVWASEQSWPEW